MSESNVTPSEKEKKTGDEIVKGNEPFNEMAIDIIGDRISQEFENIIGNETKASILIATCVALFAIFSLPNSTLNLVGFFAKTIGNQITVLIIWSSFVYAFFASLVVIFPAGKLRSIRPRQWNNTLAVMDLSKSKEIIKEDLIKNFEFIHKHRLRDTKQLKGSFIAMAIGLVVMLVGMILYPSAG